MRSRVIGAGLAGCEAAYQLAERGISVELFEMKPKKKSPAHSSDNFCELVCSNSLRGSALSNAVGLLKEEMRRLGSLIIQAADNTKVPAGGALAVNRDLFSEYATEKIRRHDNITVIEKEVQELDLSVPTIIASGPLTSDSLFASLRGLLGEEYLHFFDAAAPIVSGESVDMDNAFIADRYDKGDSDYINCPFSKEEYDVFYNNIILAKGVEFHDFETHGIFEGCMPVEEMAKRGYDTMRYGMLKPVGLTDPRTGKRPFAVVQLRKENVEGSMYNIVGFQTHLTFSEQKRVFSLVPALKNAEFLRYGVMHRNTYINSPRLLSEHYQLKSNPNIFFAGQMTGVEGYVESAASGLYCGMNMARILYGKPLITFPSSTAMGALSKYISTADAKHFQPMNINFGIISPLDIKIRDKKIVREAIAERALCELSKTILDS